MVLVGTHWTSAEAARISHYGLTSVESSMAMYYQPGAIQSLCPPDFDGAYIAAGCKSIVWCADGMLRFRDGCPEGKLFDEKCLCCRDADEFECSVNEISAHASAEIEDDDARAHGEEALVATDKKNDMTKKKKCKGEECESEADNLADAGANELAGQTSADCEAGFTGISTNSDCTSINVCDQGQLTMAMDCPTGTLFDDNTKDCVKWHRQFVCINSLVEAQTVNIVENSPDCPRGASGLSPLTDCVGYNVCFLGTKLFETQCGTGFLFNVNTLQCERWYREFVCPPKDVATPNSSQPAQTQPKVEDQILEKVNVSSRGTCPSGHTGFAPTPDCRSTNVCRGGVFKYALDCGDGQLFDVDLGRCIKGYRGFVCGGDAEGDEDLPAPTSQPTPTISMDRICPEDYTGMIPTPGCSGSYACRRGKFLMGPIRCPSGTFFDGTTTSCKEKYDGFVCSADEAGIGTQDTDAPTTSPVEVGPCRPGFTGLTRTQECEGANVCRDGNYLTSIDCPKGSLFDVNVQQCVHWYRNFVCGGIVPDAANEKEEKGANAKAEKNEKEVENKAEKAEKRKKSEKDDATSEKSAVVTDGLESPVPVPPPMRPRSRCPKGFTGRVPANEECSAYINCEKGKYDNHGVVSCRPDGLYVFDFLSQRCQAFEPDEYFECVYTILTTDEEPLAKELIAQLGNV